MGLYDDEKQYPGPLWDTIRSLIKQLEEGGYNTCPESLKQGCIFEIPDEAPSTE